LNVDFDLTDLRLFVHVVEGGSITAGAQATNLSLAACSERVQGMERALAAPLLVRSRRGVRPTAAGLTLLRHARIVLEQAGRLRSDLEDRARIRRLHLSLVGTSAAMREYLPDALGDFLAGRPHVNVTVAEAASEDAAQAVLAGAADIGFVTARPTAEGLELYPLALNRFALAVPRDHPLVSASGGRPIKEALADGYDVVGLLAGSALQDTWDKRVAQRGAALNHRVRVPSFDAQLRLVERGVGIALMPEAAALRGARSMAIEVLALSDASLTRRLLVCVKHLSALQPDAQALIGQLRRTNRGARAGSGSTSQIGPENVRRNTVTSASGSPDRR
jgi:DNA-binding transcriptional LysR family regulator